MTLAEVTSNFTVTPSLALVFWTLVAACCVGAGCVTAAKGRWGWLLVGLVTGGLAWLLSAFLIAAPDSFWARHFYGSDKQARSMAAFPDQSPGAVT